MKYMSHDEIRKTWFSFFESKNHTKIDSAPLVPINDDSLLWVNAGVTPLKKYFDGTEVPNNRRMTSIQKCIRTNDIDNVGITKTHLTFFEMMGNFSVGDYFRDEAISYAYELLTSKDYFNIPKDLLYVTIYPSDLETKNKWIEVGMDTTHIIPIEGNFWEIGEGPCGPDSEIFFDRGEKYDPNKDAFEKLKRDQDQDRYVEIWNNVFSQYNAQKGVERQNYKELPSKNIDTGAGLERFCCIFQNVDSNFDTDLFKPIITHLEELTKYQYTGQKEFKIIVDHIRTITFALADGASFENTGRGYVLRRLLRRGVRYGKVVGFSEPFMYKLVSEVIDVMKNAYPYLLEKRPYIESLVLEEEKLFFKTLESGERRLRELVKDSNDGMISGEDAFKLYDTFGFPFELTEEYLSELGFRVSKEEFDKYMKIQKELARKNVKNTTSMASQKQVLLDFKEPSEFVYGIYRLKSKVTAIFSKDKIIDSVDHDTYIALDRTCFYAESGGQVSDTGMIVGDTFKARVLDVFKAPNGQHIHKVKLLTGVISIGDLCELVLDRDERKHTECNHSSVHMLQYALQQVISPTIKQSGSYVDGEKLRFDFTYSNKISDDDLINIERFINDMIGENLIVSTEVMPLEKAKEMGAMALFSEKYSDMVRVVKIGKSIELCGGTHAINTKDIEKIAICSFESKGSNIYRIEATTGSKIPNVLSNYVEPYKNEILRLLMKAKRILDDANKLGINLDFDVDVETKKLTSYKDIIFYRNELQYVHHEVKLLEKKYKDIKQHKALDNLDNYKDNIKEYDNGYSSLIMKVDNKDINSLKTIADSLINNMDKGFIFFANRKDDDSVNFIARSNCFVNAGLIVKDASVSSDGNGGGSPTFAQGGGKNTLNLDKIFNHIEKVLKNGE
ncbi:MAG: alanine--tRNA ligase [Bacilli bacterium]|nr:alanine--tRNA ligase [Bacilli bacterium]